jgi:hypothetical protein
MTNIGQFIARAGDIIQLLVNISVGLAFLIFFWGLAKFIFKIGGSEKAVDEGKNTMIWGILAIFVMLSIWGIIYFIRLSFNIEPGIPDPGPGFRDTYV